MDTASVHSRNYFLLGAAFANVCFAGKRKNHRKSEGKAGKRLFFISGCKQGSIWIAKFVMGGLWIKLRLRFINQFWFYVKIMPNCGMVSIMLSFWRFYWKSFGKVFIGSKQILIACKLTELPNFHEISQHGCTSIWIQKPTLFMNLVQTKMFPANIWESPGIQIGM